MQAQDTATVIISKKQAHAFAVAVFADIHAYRETHQKEFEEFLRTEQEKEGGVGGKFLPCKCERNTRVVL